MDSINLTVHLFSKKVELRTSPNAEPYVLLTPTTCTQTPLSLLTIVGNKGDISVHWHEIVDIL